MNALTSLIAINGFARHSRISTTADTYVHSDPVESESTEMIAAKISSADLLNERGICGTIAVQESEMMQYQRAIPVRGLPFGCLN